MQNTPMQNYEAIWVRFSARFLSDFATTVEPLRKLTRQGTEWQWGKEENEAFEALENQLAEASMTAFNGKEAPTEVVTDASPVGLGGILVQEKQGALHLRAEA